MTRFVLGICLLFGTGMLAVAAGLTYVATDASPTFFSSPAHIADPDAFTKPTPKCGTVSNLAVVATLHRDPTPIKVALDCQKANGKRFDVIRFDFTGKGQFDAKNALPLEYPGGNDASFASFGEKILEATIDGHTVPITVRGIYFSSKNDRSLMIYLGCAVQGTCAFGDKTFPVRIMDGNSNLRFGDPFQIVDDEDMGLFPMDGDSIQVDANGDNFVDSEQTISAYYGSPIRVNGAWYEVTLSADRTEIQAKPFGGKLSTVRLPRAPWNAQIVSSQYLLNLTSDTRETTIPAGKYRIIIYNDEVPVTGKDPVKLMYMYFDPGAKPVLIEAPANETRDVAIGCPLTACVGVKKEKGQAVFSLSLTDSGGNPISTIVAMNGAGLPEKLQFEVVNGQGKKAFSGAFEYG